MLLQPRSRSAARVVALILVALALVAGLFPLRASSVMAQDDTAEADATLRVVHASPGAPEVDVLLDGQTLLQGLAYGSASNYATITPEEHRLQVVPTGQTADAAVVDETIDAVPGQAYLLAVFGLLNDIGGDIYDVDLSEIEPGNARVRLINFSPDAGAIDLLETGGDEWFGDVELGGASDYQDIARGPTARTCGVRRTESCSRSASCHLKRRASTTSSSSVRWRTIRSRFSRW